MNLLQIRTQFVKISGRYDLVVNATAFADNGADWYIQQGQKSLERRVNVKAAKAKVFKDLDVGTYLISVENCRAITGVNILDKDASIPLEKLDPSRDKLDVTLYSTPLSTADRGKPIYWYPTNLRRSPDNLDDSGDSITLQSYLDTITVSDPTLTGLVIYPPTDLEYSIQVSGLFYNDELSDDTDFNYWSTNYSMLLVMSALHQLEMVYRGSKSAGAWVALIDAELENIDKDAAEEESADVTKTRG